MYKKISCYRLSDDYLLDNSKNVTTNWNIDNGYNNEDIEAYPERGFVAGVKSGFYSILQLNTKDFDYICGGTFQGFHV